MKIPFKRIGLGIALASLIGFYSSRVNSDPPKNIIDLNNPEKTQVQEKEKTLENLSEDYLDEVGEIEISFGGDICSLRKKYLATLEGMLAQEKRKADLKTSLQLNQEIERIKSENYPALTTSEYLPIKTLNNNYLSQALIVKKAQASRTLSAIKAYDSSLKTLQEELTRKGELKEAEKIEEARKDLAKSPEYLESKYIIEKQELPKRTHKISNLEVRAKQETSPTTYKNSQEQAYAFLNPKNQDSLDLVFEHPRISTIGKKMNKAELHFIVPEGRRTETRENIAVYAGQELLGEKSGADLGECSIPLKPEYFKKNPASRYLLRIQVKGTSDGLGILKSSSKLVLQYEE